MNIGNLNKIAGECVHCGKNVTYAEAENIDNEHGPQEDFVCSECVGLIDEGGFRGEKAIC